MEGLGLLYLFRDVVDMGARGRGEEGLESLRTPHLCT